MCENSKIIYSNFYLNDIIVIHFSNLTDEESEMIRCRKNDEDMEK